MSKPAETPEPIHMKEDYFDQEARDQVTRERGICMAQDCNVRKYFKELEACEKRLEMKPYTAEQCVQEFHDLIEAIDICMADKAFVKLA